MSLQKNFSITCTSRTFAAQYTNRSRNQIKRSREHKRKSSKCSTNLNRRFDQGLLPLSLWIIARWRVRKAPRHRSQKKFVRIFFVYLAQIYAKLFEKSYTFLWGFPTEGYARSELVIGIANREPQSKDLRL